METRPVSKLTLRLTFELEKLEHWLVLITIELILVILVP